MMNPAMKTFPFLDLKKLHKALDVQIRAAMDRVLAHGRFINGPEVGEFEEKWNAYCASKAAIGASNGTSALHAALAAIGVGPDDEVILPSHTFVATAESVRLAGARPVFAEIDEAAMLIDPAAIEPLITPRTRAIVPVHLYGAPADMDPINEIACRHEIPVIEDAAQAHGAVYKTRKAGALGLAAAFSFFPGKNLGAFGDGGAVTTLDEELGRKISRYVNHGREAKYEHIEMGTNYRLDTLQAAILLVKLEHLENWNERRRSVAARYVQVLSSEPFDSHPVPFQQIPAGCSSAYHLFEIRVADRDRVQAELKKRGVMTGIHYPIPCHLQPSMAGFSAGRGSLPVTERVADEVLSLPMCPTMEPDDAEEICEILKGVLFS